METDTEIEIRHCHWHAVNAEHWGKNFKSTSVYQVHNLISLKESSTLGGKVLLWENQSMDSHGLNDSHFFCSHVIFMFSEWEKNI